MADYLYLEDVPIGTRWSVPEFTVTEEEIIEFARQYDPQPMHIDPEFARRGRFGGLIASGWHTAALVMRATVDARLFGDTEVLGLGVEQVQWPLPVRPGDTLRVDIKVISSVPSRSNPRYGVVKVRTQARNQNGEVVLVVNPSCWVPRRPASKA